MFSYMISKGVVQIVVAATLLDKVPIIYTALYIPTVARKNKALNPFFTPCLTHSLQGPD